MGRFARHQSGKAEAHTPVTANWIQRQTTTRKNIAGFDEARPGLVSAKKDHPFGLGHVGRTKSDLTTTLASTMHMHRAIRYLIFRYLDIYH